MPTIDIDSYRGAFTGGAKSYMFYYRPSFPGGFGDTEQSTYLVRATTMPETAIEEITTNWQGQDFKFAGKYTFSDWSVTFNCDAKATIYKSFGNWMNLVHDPTSNSHSLPNEYMVSQNLEMLGPDGSPIQRLFLYKAWPKNIGPITLDYSQNDVSTFDVTYSYIYHAMEGVNYDHKPSFAG
jgi:hypothetical protein